MVHRDARVITSFSDQLREVKLMHKKQAANDNNRSSQNGTEWICFLHLEWPTMDVKAEKRAVADRGDATHDLRCRNHSFRIFRFFLFAFVIAASPV